MIFYCVEIAVAAEFHHVKECALQMFCSMKIQFLQQKNTIGFFGNGIFYYICAILLYPKKNIFKISILKS